MANTPAGDGSGAGVNAKSLMGCVDTKLPVAPVNPAYAAWLSLSTRPFHAKTPFPITGKGDFVFGGESEISG